MTTDINTRVLVAGATGTLGGMVVDELARAGASVRALVRPGKEASLERTDVEVTVGDLEDQDSLRRAVEGVDAIVSCVQGGPETIVDGQLRLLECAAERAVRRFIPSDFSFDLFSLSPGANLNSDWRRTFAHRAEALGVDTQVVHVLNGCFLDMQVSFGFLGAFDLSRGTMALWGEGNEPMDFTTYRDTARYTALAAMQPDVPSRFEVVGDTLTFWELREAVEAASGRSFAVERKGSLADLDALIDERIEGDPANLYAYLPLMYWRAMLNGEGRLRHAIHARFPAVRPQGVRAFVRDHRDAFRA